MTRFTRHLAAAAACAALSLPVLAQTTAPSPATAAPTATATMPGNAGQAGNRQAKRQQWKEQRGERHTARLAELKKTLAITPAQEPAWTSFTQAMQPRSDFARLDRQAMDTLTTPERIDRMRAQRAQRNASMDARLDATKAFYTQLEPAQQQSFDRAATRMMRMDGQGRHQMRGDKSGGKQGQQQRRQYRNQDGAATKG